MPDPTRAASRRLRDHCEPIAGSVYFAPEAFEAYKALGLDDYAQGYFCSRGACLGHPSGEVVTATFGVFNPAIVVPAVEAGWSRTEPALLLEARLQGARQALRRMFEAAGQTDPAPVRRAVEILRGVMETQDGAGRPLFSGLRSLPFPDDDLAALWRVCDYVRERRGDGHIAAWVGAGCDPVEITLLTELYWGLPLASYVYTRGWQAPEVEAAVERLEGKGYLRDGELTEAGLAYRREIERATDAMDAEVVAALGDRAEELFALLEPLKAAVLDAKGYPVDPSQTMGKDEG